jgi:hypothetical protein
MDMESAKMIEFQKQRPQRRYKRCFNDSSVVEVAAVEVEVVWAAPRPVQGLAAAASAPTADIRRHIR